MEGERQEGREETEPSLVERMEPSSQEAGSEEEERPTDYALGAHLTELRNRLDAQEEATRSLTEALQASMEGLPQAIGDAVEDAIQSLQEDSHGEEPGETPLTQNPGLRWWEKALGGRS